VQQYPLLWVHTPCFARRNVEEFVVEGGGGRDKVTRMGFESAGCVWVGGVGVVGYFEPALWDLYIQEIR